MIKEYDIHMDDKLFNSMYKISKSYGIDISDFISLCCSLTLIDKKIGKEFMKHIDKS